MLDDSSFLSVALSSPFEGEADPFCSHRSKATPLRQVQQGIRHVSCAAPTSLLARTHKHPATPTQTQPNLSTHAPRARPPARPRRQSNPPNRIGSMERETTTNTHQKNHQKAPPPPSSSLAVTPPIYTHASPSTARPHHSLLCRIRPRDQTPSHPKKTHSRRHGEVAVLREGAHQQGRVDQGGGPAPDRLHQGARRGLLALAAQGRGPPPLRQELPPPLDELPPPRPQARQLHRRRRRAHHQAPRPPRQQVVVDSGAAAGPDGQRDQELLEHAHQAQAPQPRHGPAHAPPNQRRPRRQRAHHVDHRPRLPFLPGAGVQARQRAFRLLPGQHRELREALAIGRRAQQQRREQQRRAPVPRPEPGPRPGPVHEPAVLAAQDNAARQVAPAAGHLPVLPPRRPQRGGMHLQDGVSGGPARVPVSPATGGGSIHIAR